jgi:hypothetical protein
MACPLLRPIPAFILRAHGLERQQPKQQQQVAMGVHKCRINLYANSGNYPYTSALRRLILSPGARPAPTAKRTPAEAGSSGKTGGKHAMKKLLIATAISAFAICTIPALTGQAQAAPAKNPMCALAGSQKNPMAWSEYYGCFGSRPTVERAAVRSRPGAPASGFCKMAAGEKDMVGWSQFYGCWHH